MMRCDTSFGAIRPCGSTIQKCHPERSNADSLPFQEANDCYRCGRSAEIVPDGLCGFVVTPDAGDIAEAIDKFYDGDY
jgi:hypothetical protein